MRHRERHRTERIGWPRAAVLGANDGILSTASLVVDVAAGGALRHDVLLAGIGSVVAGALSMAAGEYVSVSSQADTERADLALERRELARGLGYLAAFAAAAPGVHDQGLAIVSRYPIHDAQIRCLKRYDLGSRTRSRLALAATVSTPWRDLRLWNAHLDTRINAAERLEQLQPVIEEAARHNGPRLIGGDFNTNDVYWFRNRLPLPGGPAHGAIIRHAMKQHGFETPLPDALNTFSPLGRHLDWIFVRHLRPLAASVEPAAFSDHNAIWIRLSLEQSSESDGHRAPGHTDESHSEAEAADCSPVMESSP